VVEQHNPHRQTEYYTQDVYHGEDDLGNDVRPWVVDVAEPEALKEFGKTKDAKAEGGEDKVSHEHDEVSFIVQTHTLVDPWRSMWVLILTDMGSYIH